MRRLLYALLVTLCAAATFTAQAGAIVGGSDATTTRPWMGSLHMAGTDTQGCGTSLIAKRWALTAYHCVTAWQDSPEKVQIRFGSNDRTSGGIVARVDKVEVPPSANGIGKDIALLHLTADVDVTPAVLADATPADGSTVTMIGWGLTCAQSFPSIYYCGEPPKLLQTVNVNLSPDWQCTSPAIGINGPSELCVGSYLEGKSACFGDSGGPALVGDKVVGVTSRQTHLFLYGNCQIAPAIYTDVAVHRDWIKSVTG